MFIICALVGILKSTPAANVIDEDHFEIRVAGLHIIDELPERIASFDLEAAFAGVSIGSDDLDPTGLRIPPDRIGLVFRRVFLMICRHTDVFGSSNRTFRRL
jgi:hypothetical protein